MYSHKIPPAVPLTPLMFEEVHELLVECGLRFGGIENQIMMPSR
jgi:hypothetical protein